MADENATESNEMIENPVQATATEQVPAGSTAPTQLEETGQKPTEAVNDGQAIMASEHEGIQPTVEKPTIRNKDVTTAVSSTTEGSGIGAGKTSDALKGQAPNPVHSAPKSPAVPSPKALADKSNKHTVAVPTAGYASADIKEAETFGRVDESGNVFVRQGDTERKVGEFPGAPAQEALDLYARRFLDLKAKVDLFSTRLRSSSIKSREIDESIKTLSKETENPDAVGNLSALKEQLDLLKTEGQKKKEELSKARKAAAAKALEERTAIVQKAENLAASLNGNSTNWKKTAEEFRSLFEHWQEHQRNSARLDKKDADALWKRFSSARTTFSQGRRKWVQERDTERSEIKGLKEAIIKEANEIKTSTDWGETSRRFRDLMDRWKQAGRAGHKEDDELWARFREASDTFFNARQADREQRNTSESSNLVKKEELLKKAESLVPVSDAATAKKARQALADIQQEWDEIGYVPRDDVHRIESRLDAVDRQIKAVEDAAWQKSDPEADARKSNFEVQLNAQLSELADKIAAESDPKKKASLEAEKATKEQWLNAVK